jgi:hypothetical protein
LIDSELDRVKGAGARVIHVKSGPAYGRSPADPAYDPFWARVNEAGLPVASSGWPHSEGIAEPADFAGKLTALGEDGTRKVMRSNVAERIGLPG